jgi:hypothetical protein
MANNMARQSRASIGYERLAETLANALERIISPAPFPQPPLITSFLETLTNSVAGQGRTLETLSTTLETLSQGHLQQGKLIAQHGTTLETLAQTN